MEKQRLDLLLVAAGLAPNLEKARRMIYAGEVRVDGQLVDQAGTQVAVAAVLMLKPKPRFVSRGGEKLSAALAQFPVAVAGCVAADIGASTGGFTDCLLQHQAAKVYAIDVGYGQLAWPLRQDGRVVVMERVNARYMDALPEMVDVVVSDVSFISLRTIYATAVKWLKPGGHVISLIKPQFEAPREHVEKGGVVRDAAVHREVLKHITASLAELDLGLQGLMPSPLLGPAGNVEFLGWWCYLRAEAARLVWIDRAMAQAERLKQE